jgi:hypothetical protein
MDSKRTNFRINTPRFAGLVLLLAVIMVQANCSDPNTDAPLSTGVHPSAWNNTRFLKSDTFHGVAADNQGTSSCLICHGNDLYGSGNIPGCFTCHFDTAGSRIPEGTGWVHGLAQHADLEAHMDVCNTCHTVHRKYGTGPDVCHDCHGAGINHVLGQAWLDRNDPQFHGDAAKDDCADCHNLSQKCFECHFGTVGSKAPPGSGWEHGNNDAHKGFAIFAGTCNQCHDLSRSFGNAPADCHDCHGEGADHVFGQAWLDTKSQLFHGDASLDDCSDCHDLSQACFECHFGAAGSKSPPGSGWNHGDNDAHEKYSSYDTVCNRCHTLNRSYGNAPGSCHDCHGGGD